MSSVYAGCRVVTVQLSTPEPPSNARRAVHHSVLVDGWLVPGVPDNAWGEWVGGSRWFAAGACPQKQIPRSAECDTATSVVSVPLRT